MSQSALPKYASIFRDTHFPPIDNQGAIGSCASQSITRNQFTNAVSRVIHDRDETSGFCPRDNFSQAFTPKYSYNIAGPGTAWVYEFISEHGALFQNEGIFKKNDSADGRSLGGSVYCDKQGKRHTESTSMLVGKGQMERALNYRIRSFEQIWITKPPYNESLTTCREGEALLRKIKEAVVRGDAVVTGGYPGRWVYTGIESVGNLGAAGEHICVAAAGNGGGGHQVTIVGYDDDITAIFAGVRLKGAFLIANSYGVGWQNKGLCWMAYDAVNTRSEHEELNDPSLYSGPMYLTPSRGFAMFPSALVNCSQTLRFREKGTYELYGKTYPAFTAFDEQSGKYLGYKTDKDDRSLTLLDEEGPRFAFIPYEELIAVQTSDKTYKKDEYNGSYWIYAADKEGDAEGWRVLDAGTGFSSSGRTCGLASHNACRYPEAKSFITDVPPAGEFRSRLAIAAGKDVPSNRIWTLDQFCFINWRRDVVIGMPEYYVKATVSATDRDCFALLLTRKEKKTGAQTRKHLPAMFRYTSSRPFYGKREKGGYMNFEGVYKGPECMAELAFSLEPLLKLPKGKRFEDYIWGVELKKGRNGRAKLLDASLCDSCKTVLSYKEATGKKIEF